MCHECVCVFIFKDFWEEEAKIKKESMCATYVYTPSVGCSS